MYLEYVLCDCKISFEVECLLEREKIDFIPFFPSSHKKIFNFLSSFLLHSSSLFYWSNNNIIDMASTSGMVHNNKDQNRSSSSFISFNLIFFLLLPFKTCKLFFLCRTTLCALERKVKLINLWMMFLAHSFGFKNSWFCG